MEVVEFQNNCIQFDPDLIVQKILIDGPTYFFDEYAPGKEFEFKKAIANTLNVHIRDIVIVGSGKLGFSIKPEDAIEDLSLYLYKQFDHDYLISNEAKKSDLDIAIISSTLFDKEIENLFTHTGSYKTFIGKNRTDFAKFILKGRFIIDYLPQDFQLSQEMQNVQSKLQMEYGRDINLEIYKSWYFFEKYHQNNIFNIKLNLLK